eukprot:c27564_g1_i1 orf=300-2807(-)
MMTSLSVFKAAVTGFALTVHSKAFCKENLYIKLKGSRRSGSFSVPYGHPKGAFQATGVLDKQNGAANGSNPSRSNSTDPAREAFERLFLQAQTLEDSIRTQSSCVAEPHLSFNLSKLELDLHTVIEALRMKEEDLQTAKLTLVAEQQEVDQRKASLWDRERELHIAEMNHSSIQDELTRAKQDCSQQALDLNGLKQALKKREEEVRKSQEDLERKQDELSLLKSDLQKKDDAVAKASTELESRDLLLREAQDHISKQSMEVSELRMKLESRERDLLRAEKEIQLRQEKLQAADQNLEMRAVAWLAAQDDMKDLEQELLKSKGLADVLGSELEKSKALLVQSRRELEASHRVVEDFRKKTQLQEMEFSKQRDELYQQKATIQSYQLNLAQAQREVLTEREHFKSMLSSYKELEDKLRKSELQEAELEAELQKEELALQDSVEEVNSLNRELQQRDSLLSETELSLHLMEAKLVAANLEVQQVKSDLANIQFTLKDKEIELETAQKIAQELQKQVVQLKGSLTMNEDHLLKAISLLAQKEEQFNAMCKNADDTEVKLSQATFIVKEIAALSRTLVDASSQGKAFAFNGESLLAQTNCDLFAANRSVLEKELQLQRLREQSADNALKGQKAQEELATVQEYLGRKENELSNTQKGLAAKEQEIENLLCRWEEREGELKKLQDEVIEEAKGLITLHELAHSGIVGTETPAQAALEKLEVEAAKSTVEAAMHALTNLAELSCKLVNGDPVVDEVIDAEGGTLVACATGSNIVEHLIVPEMPSVHDSTDLEAPKATFDKRDMSLECIRSALDNLSKLSRNLMEKTGSGLDFETAAQNSCFS